MTPLASPKPTRRPSRKISPLLVGGSIGLATLGAAGAAWAMRPAPPAEAAQNQSQGKAQDQNKNGQGASKAAVKVKVTHPRKGGITRTTTQLAEIRFFAHVQLFAKAAGYLRSQIVDIGDVVRMGDVMAEVYAPELKQQVEQAAAIVEQSRAEVAQADTFVTVSEAEIRAQAAIVKQREAQIAAYTATRKFREKEYLRYTEIAANGAIDQRAADEKQEDFESAKAGELVAVAAVDAARGALAKALAEAEKAKADVKAARARLLVAEARESSARIYEQYTKLTAPFDGVVTERNFYDGDFVRDAAQQNNQMPVLALARTDLMRVVIYIPDALVPYVDRGDEAVIKVLALNGQEFRGTVSRYSNMENAANRAMRVEIDLPNPSGRLKHGMYGDVTILLEPPTNVLTIPSPGLVENDGHGGGTVFVARGKKASKVSVRVGKDNGLVAEILQGLGPDDEVIVNYSGSMEEGSEVDPMPATVGDAKKQAGQG